MSATARTAPLPQSAPIPVTVIIPTYNRADLAAGCLHSLFAQPVLPEAVVVVDDGSTDDTVPMLKQQWPQVQVVVQPENLGFAQAVNAGIHAARTPWLLLLNNDMTLDADFLQQMWARAEASGADMVAPLVLWDGDRNRIYSAGDRIGVNGRPEAIGFRALRQGFHIPNEIFSVSAGAGLYRAEIFQDIGCFDKYFLAYFEDSDLGFRARLAGYQPVLAPLAIAYHEGSASIAGKTWWRALQCFRNHSLLVLKNFPLPLIFTCLLPLLRESLHQAVAAFSACRCEFGAVRAFLLVVGVRFAMLLLLPHLWQERRRIQRSRRIPLAELRRLLSMTHEG
ncbi:MAG: glycosyltransferase family 2 protein [Candidatus Hydrogenedentes bacterium]|nr:glycosyltransferase family 2 protein [Candidatus Hydrogenedentota bacterium]